MPTRRENENLKPRHRYGSFGERYPDYVSWLDGTVWEIDIETEINEEPLNNFRASLWYQAKEMGVKLVSKVTVTEDERRVLLIQALER